MTKKTQKSNELKKKNGTSAFQKSPNAIDELYRIDEEVKNNSLFNDGQWGEKQTLGVGLEWMKQVGEKIVLNWLIK